MKLCLPIAMCGPFCSLLPTKMIAVPLPAAIASRTSGQVRSSIQTERVCAPAGTVTAGGTTTAALSLASLTTVPSVGVGPPRVTVPIAVRRPGAGRR